MNLKRYFIIFYDFFSFYINNTYHIFLNLKRQQLNSENVGDIISRVPQKLIKIFI